jgi:hypothetical protein
MINSRRMRWAGNVASMQEKRNECRISVEKREGKKPLEIPRHWREDNIGTCFSHAVTVEVIETSKGTQQ